MHGTSPSLGIDVHDVGSDTKCFAVGQVWTVEPGIYIPAEEIGIRLETDVLVTETGVEDLIPNAPIDPDAIEAAMAQQA
jgi:Xaa-Pro aminopeptidase